MSITFNIDGRKATSIPCPFCKHAVEFGYAEDNGKGGCCDMYCDGTTGDFSDTVNFSNRNAFDILEMLGYDTSDYMGEISDLAAFRRKIMLRLNTNVDSAVREAYHLPSGHAGVEVDMSGDVPRIERKGCAVYSGGSSKSQITRRLNSLDKLAQMAQDANSSILWG
jgi:hypothetical protein